MDIMKVVVEHLTNTLGVRTSTEKPAKTQLPIVIVTRVGGGGSMFTEEIRVAVRTWASSESESYKLGMEASKAMFSLPAADDNVVSVSQNSFYSDVYINGDPRWTGIYDVFCNR